MKIIFKYVLLLLLIGLQNEVMAQLSVSITGTFNGCSPQNLTFGCNVSGAVGEIYYSWSSGNGDVSVLASPTFSYLSPGRYNVSVTVTSGGETATDIREIVIFNGPTARFNDTAVVGCVPYRFLPQSFSIPGDAQITGWLWYFGDGYSSTHQTTPHIYRNPGTYTVSLEVTDANGCRNEYHTQVFTLSKGPDVSITAHNAHWCVAPHDVQFSADVSTSVGLGGPYTAEWNFGDGETGEGDSPTHTYTQTGNYNVSLVATDSYGCATQVTENNLVSIGNLSANCTVPDEVCVNANTLYRSDVVDVECLWDFGDGTPVQYGPEVFHTYSQPGVYTVSFTADPDGQCRQTRIFNVNAVRVEASFTTEPSDLFSCDYPFSVRFISNSIGENLTYLYNFGDTYMGFDSVSVHSYMENGRYSPTLTVTSPGGCISHFTGPEIVVNRPDVGLHSNGPGGCVPASILFTNNSDYTDNSAIVDFLWDFGDGTSQHTDVPEVEHTYSEYGEYYPTLTITDTSGCVVTGQLKEWYSIVTGNQILPENFGVTDEFHNFIPGDTLCPQDVVYLYNSMSHMSDTCKFIFSVSAGINAWEINSYQTYRPYSFNIDTGWNRVAMSVESRNCVSPMILWDSVYVKPPILRTAISTHCSSPFRYTYRITNNLGAQYWDWLVVNTATNEVIFRDLHSSLDSITIIYPTYGSYSCTLTAHNDDSGCECVHRAVSTISQPIFQWEISTDTLCLGNRLTAIVLRAPSFTEVAFDWGEHETDFDALEWIPINGITDSRYTYESGGDYDVIAYARQPDGCVSTFSRHLYVVDPQSSILPAEQMVGCLPATFTFENITPTDDPIYSVAWHFGDNSEAISGQRVEHTYTSVGSYDVSVNVMTLHGCSFSRTFHNRIKVIDIQSASVDYDIYSCLGSEITFSSAGSDASILHEWNFGDGSVMTGTNNIVSHQYAAAGNYMLTHIVSGRGGSGSACSDTSAYNTVVVENIVASDFSVDSSYYNCYPVSPTIRTTVQVEPQGTPVFCNWNMDNGDFVYIQNPQYLYTSPGIYNISFETTTLGGCNRSSSHTIEISGPEAEILLSDTLVCAGGEIHFTMLNPSNVESFVWVVGGGYNYYTEEVTHQYEYVPESGYFPVTLSIRNGNCMIDLTDQVYVFRLKSELFLTGTDGNIIGEGACSPLVGVLGYSSSDEAAARWYVNGLPLDFENDTVFWTNTSSLVDSVNLVSLTTVDSHGCIDSISREYLVYKVPDMQVSADTLICSGGQVHLSAFGGNTYYWLSPIDDSAQNQIVSPTEATIYHVYAFNEKMCMAMDSVTVDVFQDFDAGVYEQLFTINIGDTAMALVFSDMEPLNCYISPAEYAFAGNCDTLLLYPLENTDFSLILKDTLGCYEKTIDIHVDVDIKYTLDVPGAFTPMSDDENSVVYVRGLGIKELRQFRIFNRWGEEVFFSDNLNAGWDGTIGGKVQNVDTYSYYVEAEMYDGSIKTKKGNIMLLK